MLMYYVPSVPGGWKTFGTQTDSFWCCTGSGVEEYAKLVDSIYFHDQDSVYVNQFVSSEVSWPQKLASLTQQTSFPEEERTSITIQAEKPVEFVLRIRAPHWAPAIAITVNGRAEPTVPASDGYIALHRTWKTGDRVEVSLPMSLRQESVAGSPELATLAYGPLVLAAEMGGDGLSREMIEGKLGPKLDSLPPLAMPQFSAPESHPGQPVTWVKKSSADALRFETIRQVKNFNLMPLYHTQDQRYSVYWQRQT
jgi:DUF1680 family protein